MEDNAIATITLYDYRHPGTKEVEIPIVASEEWHSVPLGTRGEYVDISFSAEIIYFIEIEII